MFTSKNSKIQRYDMIGIKLNAADEHYYLLMKLMQYLNLCWGEKYSDDERIIYLWWRTLQ